MDNSTTKNLPEAPAAVTARVVSDKGFRLLFTLRDEKVSNLIAKFDEFQIAILKRGWKPETSSFSLEPRFNRVEQHPQSQLSLSNKDKETCSKCGSKATKKSGFRKDGSSWEGVFCSTGDSSHKIWLS